MILLYSKSLPEKLQHNYWITFRPLSSTRYTKLNNSFNSIYFVELLILKCILRSLINKTKWKKYLQRKNANFKKDIFSVIETDP